MERSEVKVAVDRNLRVIYNGTEYFVCGYRYWSNLRVSGESVTLHDLKANSTIEAPLNEVAILDIYKKRGE